MTNLFSKNVSNTVAPKYVVQLYQHGGAYDEVRVTSHESALFVVQTAIRKRFSKVVLIKGKQRAEYNARNGYQPIVTP